jgi:hypothetical protein
MTAERTVSQWLELYGQGPDKENDCRACNKFMRAVEDRTEPTAFCDSCAQEFLELLVERHKQARQSAKKGWQTTQLLAVEYLRTNSASEKAAIKALEELGDA